MVTVNFYNFPKMPNSTAIPAGDGIALDCQFKNPFSITSPVLVISNNAGEEIINCNLCKIDKLGRYYTVTEIMSLGNRWEVSLSVDVLTSYRGEIGGSTQYVLRAESESDSSLTDTLFPAKTEPTTVTTFATAGGVSRFNPFGSAPYTEGTYILGVVSEQADSVGAITYYALTNSQLRAFVDLLLQNVEWAYSGIVEIGQDLFKSLFNPLQYVVSCIWIPIDNAFVGNAVTSIKYGWYTFSGVTGRVITNLRQSWGYVMETPAHPQAESRGLYLNHSPYSQYRLVWEAFGDVALDSKLIVEDYITVQGFIDAVTGVSTISVFSGGNIVYTGDQQIGVPIQLAQSNSDLITAGSNAIGGFLTGGIGGALAGIASSVDSLTANVTRTGSGGNASIFQLPPRLQSTFLTVAEDSPSLMGKPLCKNVQISTLQGYVLCDSPKLSISATSPEVNEVLQHMREGFFYE